MNEMPIYWSNVLEQRNSHMNFSIRSYCKLGLTRELHLRTEKLMFHVCSQYQIDKIKQKK